MPTPKPEIHWEEIRKRKLYLAAPLYGNNLHFGFYTSVLNLALSCQRSGVSLGIKHVGCDSLVPRARNTLVAYFLESQATDLLFIDADIKFNAEDVFTTLALEEDIVGGIYPRKQLNWQRIYKAARAGVPPDQLPYYGFIPVMNWAQEGDYQLNALMEVKHLGTGFMRIRRHVIEGMIEKLGDAIQFNYATEQDNFAGKIGHDLFPTGVDVRYALGSGGRQYLSEDWAFCELARQCGYRLYAAPWIELVHSGNMDYYGTFDVMDAAVEEELEKALP